MAGHRVRAYHRPLTPRVADLRSRIGSWPSAALLNRPGGQSILAAHPRLILESAPSRAATPGSGRPDPDLDPLLQLDGLIRRHGLDGANDGLDPDLPFQGGLIGFLSYDLAPFIEAVPRRLPAGSSMPILRFGLYDTFVLVDQDRAELWAVDLLDEGEQAVRARLDRWSDLLHQPSPEAGERAELGPVTPDQTPGEFRARVEQARRYIAAGDIFQVNLSQRFATTSSRFAPLPLDTRLQAASPATYAAYLRWDEFAILSASPELFYETRGRAIITQPIKGTRPRSADSRRDEAMVAELLASPKEQAELTMIVDLERNDLGRVCEFGSVRVADPRSVMSISHLHHTVATVVGRLRADAGPIEVVRAMFPGGSITGAPKIRAMEIIDELEPCRRGVYTGSIGYWSANGRSAFNIAIRTVVAEGNRISYHVGGGIVAESDPEQEYQETLAKGRALFATLSRPGDES